MNSLYKNGLYKTSITSLPFLGHGKVRDTYLIDKDKLLIITTDRLSVFDIIINDIIPDKGKILNQLSNFWFKKLSNFIPNHLTSILPETVVLKNEIAQIHGRSVVTKYLNPIKIEAVVRGYIFGSSWKHYKNNRSICGIYLPKGLQQAAKLTEPIFTPAIKKNQGKHDENINFIEMKKYIGDQLAINIRDISIKLYEFAANYAIERGIIIADTKFEFGLDNQGKLYLIDEVLTADSSRFWLVNSYSTGISPPSFDKQFVRDYLEKIINSNKVSSALSLPNDIIKKTRDKYYEALERITGHSLRDQYE